MAFSSTFPTADRCDASFRAISLRGDLLALLGAGVLFVLVFHHAAMPMRFLYDEADYMAAARMGFRENYVETSSMSFPAFVKAGLQAVRKEIDRTELSEYIRQRKDVSFYRHYHGPLYFHWLTLMTRVSTRETWLRAAGLTFHLLTFGTIFAGILALFGHEGRPAAWIASSAYLFSITNIGASLGVSPHAMYMWVAVVTLFAIGRFLVTAKSNHLLLSIACATVALCVLEFGIFLFLTLVVSTLIMRRRLLSRNPDLRLAPMVGKGAALALGVCALLWPAGLFKLSLLKAYLSLPYILLVRKHSFGMTASDLWSQRLTQSPLEYGILILCAAAAIGALRSHRLRPALLPFIVYAGVILLLTVKSDTDRYMSSAFPPLYVIGGVVLANRMRTIAPTTRTALFGVTALALFFNAAHEIPLTAAAASAEKHDTVDFVRRHRHRLRAVLVPAPCAPTLQYYVPEVVVRSYRPEASGETAQVRRLLARAPVDALFVYRAGQERLGSLDRELRFQAERVAGPEEADPTCGPFNVYFFKHRRLEGARQP